MGGYFSSISRVFQILANRPRENISKRVIVNLEVYLGGNLQGNLRGRSTSLLLYILVPVSVKYPPIELRELHTRVFRRDECPRPRTRERLVKYPPMELGGVGVACRSPVGRAVASTPSLIHVENVILLGLLLHVRQLQNDFLVYLAAQSR